MDRGTLIDKKKGSEIPTRMWVAAFLVSQPSFLFGYATAALNACLVVGDGDSADACYDNTDDESTNCPPGTLFNDIKMTTTEAEIATSLLVLGAWIGCLLGNAPSEKYGRRLTTLGNNIFFIVGAVLCCIADKWVLFFGRFICGLGVGIESVVVPVLLSEIASPDTRGTITTLHQLMITFGIFVAGLLGFAFVNYVSSGWVGVQAMIAIPAMLMLICMPLVPESPKWLLIRGRKEEAVATMKSLRSDGYDVDAEILTIEEEIADSPHEEATWAEVFACKRAMIIGCGLMFFTAITGINSVIFYSSTIFGFAGFDNAIAATVAVGAINFTATGVATYLVDIYGRKQLLWVGTNIMNGALIMLAVVLLGANDAGVVQGVFAVIAVLAYVVGFAIGLGAVSWVVLSEIMSTHLRSKAFGLFVSINWGCNLVIGLTTLTAIEGLGGTKSSMDDEETEDSEKEGVAYLYILFAVMCIITSIFIYVLVPETKGKSPEDFQASDKPKKSRTDDADASANPMRTARAQPPRSTSAPSLPSSARTMRREEQDRP